MKRISLDVYSLTICGQDKYIFSKMTKCPITLSLIMKNKNWSKKMTNKIVSVCFIQDTCR